MKILINKAENGWVLKSKSPFNEEPDEVLTRVVDCEDLSEAESTIALFHQIMDLLECTWGKREQENIKIFTLPGYDSTMKDDEQLEKVLDMAEDVLDRLSDVNEFPKSKDKWSKTDEVVKAVKYYKSLVDKKSFD